MSLHPCRHFLVGPTDDAHSALLESALRGEGCEVDWLQTDRPLGSLEEILARPRPTSAIFRRAVSAPHPDPGVEHYLETETREFVMALAELTPEWNWYPATPAVVYRAGIKPLQLHLAQQVGLSVPKTVIGSGASLLGASGVGSGWIAKPLRSQRVVLAGAHRWLGTCRVDEHLTGTDLAPAIYQQSLEILFEVRVVVVNDVVSGFRVRTPRADYLDLKDTLEECNYEPIAVPEAIRRGLLDLLRNLGVRFCSSDFVVGPSGQWTFLELNPNGQWYFLQEGTGVDLMRSALAAQHAPVASPTGR